MDGINCFEIGSSIAPDACIMVSAGLLSVDGVCCDFVGFVLFDFGALVVPVIKVNISHLPQPGHLAGSASIGILLSVGIVVFFVFRLLGVVGVASVDSVLVDSVVGFVRFVFGAFVVAENQRAKEK